MYSNAIFYSDQIVIPEGEFNFLLDPTPDPLACWSCGRYREEGRTIDIYPWPTPVPICKAPRFCIEKLRIFGEKIKARELMLADTTLTQPSAAPPKDLKKMKKEVEGLWLGPAKGVWGRKRRPNPPPWSMKKHPCFNGDYYRSPVLQQTYRDSMILIQNEMRTRMDVYRKARRELEQDKTLKSLTDAEKASGFQVPANPMSGQVMTLTGASPGIMTPALPGPRPTPSPAQTTSVITHTTTSATSSAPSSVSGSPTKSPAFVIADKSGASKPPTATLAAGKTNQQKMDIDDDQQFPSLTAVKEQRNDSLRQSDEEQSKRHWFTKEKIGHCIYDIDGEKGTVTDVVQPPTNSGGSEKKLIKLAKAAAAAAAPVTLAKRNHE